MQKLISFQKMFRTLLGSLKFQLEKSFILRTLEAFMVHFSFREDRLPLPFGIYAKQRTAAVALADLRLFIEIV